MKTITDRQRLYAETSYYCYYYWTAASGLEVCRVDL